MLVYIAILTPVLLLFCGLVVDVGQMEVRRLQMQSASDAAALGGAQELERGVDNWTTDGQGDATTNGFTNGQANTTVTLQTQPTYGAYAGFYDAVQATVTQQVPLSFMSLLGGRYGTVTTQSTALVAPCAYLSGATGLTTAALAISSGTYVSSTCPWYINRSATMDGGSAFGALAENITGPSGSTTLAVSGGSSPRFNAETHSDPLAAIVQPSAGACSATTSSTGNLALTPGTYCALNVTCPTTCLVSMQPGLYVFAGGLTAVNAVFYGTGVTMYFTKRGSSYGTVKFSTTNSQNGNLSLFFGTAPTDSSDGGIPGVLMMNDRNWVHTNAQDFVFSGDSGSGSPSGIYADGIVYLTGTGVSFSTSYFYNAGHYLALDADNAVFTNGSFAVLRSDFSSLSGGSPFMPQGGLVQ